MKIVCAPASFKECLTARQVAEAMAVGVRQADPAIECDVCPIGDGGEGTSEALVAAAGGSFLEFPVTGPLGQPITARIGLIDDGRCAIVELAEASGLALVPVDQRDPTRTTTFGTGQLIARAMELRCREIIVCIGGSATVDGGTGIAQAMGWRFLDDQGREVNQPLMCGGALRRIVKVVAPAAGRSSIPRIRVACDVTNPLCGPNGAAAVYGPQKGATIEQVRNLDEGLAHLSRVVGGDPTQLGAGAAGGAGFGLVQFCGATLERGIELVLDAVNFDDRVRGASLVLTGEGRLDEQSLHGKACMGVANHAARFGVPTIGIVGTAGEHAERCVGPLEAGLLRRFIDLTARAGHDRSMRDTASLIRQSAGEIAREMSGHYHE
jgi:glycerate kinase